MKGMAGNASKVAGMLARGIRSKFEATRGQVANVAPKDTINADDIQLPACQARFRNQDPEAAVRRVIASEILEGRGKTSTIPTKAVKLSWKEICPSTLGSIPTITAALSAREGRALRGLPKAKAAKNTDPMIPARNTETGKPLTRT